MNDKKRIDDDDDQEQEQEEDKQRRFTCFFFDTFLICVWLFFLFLAFISLLYTIPGFKERIESYFSGEFFALITGNVLMVITALRILSNYNCVWHVPIWCYVVMQIVYRVGIHQGWMYQPVNIYWGTSIPASILAIVYVPISGALARLAEPSVGMMRNKGVRQRVGGRRRI